MLSKTFAFEDLPLTFPVLEFYSDLSIEYPIEIYFLIVFLVILFIYSQS